MNPGRKTKTLWRGKFVFSHESHIFYRKAYSERQAKVLMCREISQKHGVPYGFVIEHFSEGKENYSIQREE